MKKNIEEKQNFKETENKNIKNKVEPNEMDNCKEK